MQKRITVFFLVIRCLHQLLIVICQYARHWRFSVFILFFRFCYWKFICFWFSVNIFSFCLPKQFWVCQLLLSTMRFSSFPPFTLANKWIFIYLALKLSTANSQLANKIDVHSVSPKNSHSLMRHLQSSVSHRQIVYFYHKIQ